MQLALDTPAFTRARAPRLPHVPGLPAHAVPLPLPPQSLTMTYNAHRSPGPVGTHALAMICRRELTLLARPDLKKRWRKNRGFPIWKPRRDGRPNSGHPNCMSSSEAGHQ
eukprot:357929-Chlamydomonas_euryale.AAC.3